jgi:hypothetical protein
MLEARVIQLEKQAREDCGYNKSLIARLVPFLRKEAAEEATEHSMERVIFIMSYFYFE